MKDHDFGNRILRMRKARGLSQRELAELLGVSNKAVSKWETGCAKPHIDTLRKLSALFGLSLDALLSAKAAKKRITEIVITGGPCAGKTTAEDRIRAHFTKLGYTVLFVPETATELIGGGVAPWTLESNVDFQRCLLHLQMEKEKVFRMAAKAAFSSDRVLIVCDRGAMDNKAYMTEVEFAGMLAELGVSETDLRDRYGAVFHLVSAAKGAEEFYTLANNAARTETVEEAAKLDDRLIAAWMGHPHLRVIDNSTTFEEKMHRLLREISLFLGEPEPYEIERKFLIEMPNCKRLEASPNCRRVDIIQTYLSSEEGEVRVRQRGEGGHYIYTKTLKKEAGGAKRIEIESRISQEEYLSLLMEADPCRRPLRKTRYCLMYESQYFEIDVYPFWEDQAILEIELVSEDAPIHFPPEIRVLREVTDDPAYKNAALAAR